MKYLDFDIELKSISPKKQLARPKVFTNDLDSVMIRVTITDMTDTDLLGSSAEMLLYMQDRSFFQNTDVTRDGNVFKYLLKENEGNHSGIARFQLPVTTAGGKIYAQQKLEFEIVSGLETQVATEVMIHDWTTLTREARAYIDDFELIVNDAKSQVEANILETAVEEKFDGLEAEYATDLTQVKTQLAETMLVKADKEEVRIKSVKLELEDMSADTLGAMSGNATFNLLSIPQDDSVSKPRLSPQINNLLFKDFNGKVTTVATVGSEIAINNTRLNKDAIPKTGILNSITISMAVGGIIKIKALSKSRDGNFNLEWEETLTTIAGEQTLYAGKDFAEKTVKEGWYIGYVSTEGRMFATTGGVGSFNFAGDLQGIGNTVTSSSLTISLTYKASQTTLDIISENQRITDRKNMLLSDLVEDTKQVVHYNNDGTVERIEHTNSLNSITRYDSFLYLNDIIKETRMLSTGETIEFNYNLETFSKEVKNLNTPINELKYDITNWLEWMRAVNATVASGQLVISGSSTSVSTHVPFVSVKNDTKYGVLITNTENTITETTGLRIGNNLTGATINQFIPPNIVGDSKIVIVTKSDVTDKTFKINLSASATTGLIKISQISVFELPVNSQIEDDFNNLTANQLVKKYVREV